MARNRYERASVAVRRKRTELPAAVTDGATGTAVRDKTCTFAPGLVHA